MDLISGGITGPGSQMLSCFFFGCGFGFELGFKFGFETFVDGLLKNGFFLK